MLIIFGPVVNHYLVMDRLIETECVLGNHASAPETAPVTSVGTPLVFENLLRPHVTYRNACVLVLGTFVLAWGKSAVSEEPTLKSLEWHRRVLIVSAPSSQDLLLAAEEKALAAWHGGDDRDVTVVRIDGSRVSGLGESSAELRRRYELPVSSFSVALVGKDGHVSLRSTTVITGSQIDAVIDAMPMRRAGQR